MWRWFMAVVVVLGVQAGTTSTAAAERAPSATGSTPASTAVTVETFAADNRTRVSRATYAVRGARLAGSGSGGTSSSSGCRKVTVHNRYATLLGFTAYRFHTWTRWCWNRAKQVVRDVSTGWYLSDVDTQYYWRGMVNQEFLHYDYGTNDGHPRSAYKHYRQGRFENCVLKYGCIGSTYPTNTLRSYYNGTFAWRTGG